MALCIANSVGAQMEKAEELDLVQYDDFSVTQPVVAWTSFALLMQFPLFQSVADRKAAMRCSGGLHDIDKSNGDDRNEHGEQNETAIKHGEISLFAMLSYSR